MESFDDFALEPVGKSLPPKILAAVDIGTNSIRAAIAESYSDGRLKIIEQLNRGVWFGKETFQRGGLSAQSMRAGIEILKMFQKRFAEYHVEPVRVVATASIREASNADIFIDRIKISTGLDVKIIDSSEEIQLSVTAIQEELGDDFPRDESKNVLIVNVGGGSTLLAILRGGTVIHSQILNIGTIRMREFLTDPNDSLENNAAIFRHAIHETLTSAEAFFPFHEVDLALAMGSEPRFVGKQIGRPSKIGDLQSVRTSRFDGLVERCMKMETPQLCQTFGINFQTAEMTVPALLTYQEIFQRTKVPSFLVGSASMRHGVLRVMASEVWGLENLDYQNDVLDAARSLAEKYRVDLDSANQTEKLAIRIFDELKNEYALPQRSCLLLRAAAILQYCGCFVSNRSFHKHSFYLISNSEIFGLRDYEKEMTAYIARYSFRSAPKPSHQAFMSLSRETRVAISKLAAILRVADALNHGNPIDPDTLQFKREENDLYIILPPDDTLLLKNRSLSSQGRMFEDVFGLRIFFMS
ncbi:MAG: hypothetical protein Q4A17_06105 [Thermoguttaceae bacterium]|nr:hypothetical protein [Thermoguttaceae bacterium]MDO4857498.1 hypothetical protein [Thermoguttaceae bacterium]